MKEIINNKNLYVVLRKKRRIFDKFYKIESTKLIANHTEISIYVGKYWLKIIYKRKQK